MDEDSILVSVRISEMFKEEAPTHKMLLKKKENCSFDEMLRSVCGSFRLRQTETMADNRRAECNTLKVALFYYSFQ